jgi:hypothetical protein
MIIVPGATQVHETRHSRELGRRIEQVVRDYQRDHPDATLSDVRIALMQRTPGGDSPDVLRRRRVLGAVIGALGVGAFTTLAANGGRFEPSSQGWMIGIAAAILGVMVVALKIARRS